MQDDIECPLCESADAFPTNERGTQFRCLVCDEVFAPPKKKATRKKLAQIADNQRRAKQQERRNAKRLGGRTTIASGATERDKADVTTSKHGGVAGGIRMECKSTRNSGYRLTLQTLQKLQSECKDDELPVLAIEFVQGNRKQSFYVLPEGHALDLLEMWDD